MLNFLFGVFGLLLGGVINLLADTLPKQILPEHSNKFRSQCQQCGYVHSIVDWLAVSQRLRGGRKCPNCGASIRERNLLVEVGTAIVLALLPLSITNYSDLFVNSIYIAILILIAVIDIENHIALNTVTFSATGLALVGSIVVTNQENTLPLAIAGMITGFLVFYVSYWFGHFTFGPGALGLGDVKVSMAMGAMLGFHRIFFALIFGITLGGLVSLLLLLSGRASKETPLPYSQYLAIAGIIMLISGVQIFQWYIS